MPKISGRESLVRILRQEKVKYVFGIPGATEVAFMDALEEATDIQFILGLHEMAVVGMAEGYSRVSGQPGFLYLHTNTGLSAGLALLSNAQVGGVPLVVAAGQQDLRLAAKEPALQADLVGIARPFTKWATQIMNASDIPQIMRQAFKTALHPPQGPVFVAIPQNLLMEELEFNYSPVGSSVFGWLPDPQGIRRAADILLQSRRPFFLVEDGVTQYEALKETVSLAERCGARVYQQWMSDVNFPVDHPLYMGDLDVNTPEIRELLGQADVLVVIGSLFFSQAIYTSQSLIPDGLKVIQIDDDSWQLNKNYAVDVALEGNIKTILTQLNQAYQHDISYSQQADVALRSETIHRDSQKVAQELAKKIASEFDHKPIAPSRLMAEIKKALPQGARVVEDCWSASAILRQVLAFSELKTYLRARGGGSIGWGLPGAIGAKLADPDCPVVCISGDGSAAWSIQSLWTAARYHLPVTFVISANAAYRQVRVMKMRIMGEQFKGRNLGTELNNPRLDFCSIARGFGLAAQRVDDPAQLGTVLSQAFRSQLPNLVEVQVDEQL
jgi:benzoylformate decarboxylase